LLVPNTICRLNALVKRFCSCWVIVKVIGKIQGGRLVLLLHLKYIGSVGSKAAFKMVIHSW
jgi:hypothetical protein